MNDIGTLPLVDIETPGSFEIDYRLGISDLAALYISRLASHSNGLLFDVVVFQRVVDVKMVQSRTAMMGQFDSLAFADWLPRSAEGFKLGVEVIGAQRAHQSTGGERSMDPALRRLSWYGGCTDCYCDSRHQWYLWPLPKFGDIAFVCEWSAVDISETRTTVSGDELRSTVERAKLLSGREGEG